MKKIKMFLIKHAGTLAAIALMISVSSLDSACYVMYHQPRVPAALDEYRK